MFHRRVAQRQSKFCFLALSRDPLVLLRMASEPSVKKLKKVDKAPAFEVVLSQTLGKESERGCKCCISAAKSGDLANIETMNVSAECRQQLLENFCSL